MGGPGSGPRPGFVKSDLRTAKAAKAGTRKSKMKARRWTKPRVASTKSQLVKHMQAKYGKPSLLGRIMSKVSDNFGSR